MLAVSALSEVKIPGSLPKDKMRTSVSPDNATQLGVVLMEAFPVTVTMPILNKRQAVHWGDSVRSYIRSSEAVSQTQYYQNLRLVKIYIKTYNKPPYFSIVFNTI